VRAPVTHALIYSSMESRQPMHKKTTRWARKRNKP
jgi:hypothetical protein